jgi:Mannosyltransferase (PIG-M)
MPLPAGTRPPIAVRRLLTPLLFLILLAGAARFVYGSLMTSEHGWTGDTHMEHGYGRTMRARQAGTGEAGRRWGPLFVLAFGTLQALHLPAPAFHAIQRGFLVLVYAFMLCLVVRMCGPPEWAGAPVQATVCKAALIFLFLQSTAAIYSISMAGIEVLLGCCVLAHLYFFERKQYFAAGVFIWLGVYLKLWPVIFVWPYVLFSLLSHTHRRYLPSLLLSWLVVAVGALPLGWRWGFFYPLAMVYDILTSPGSMVVLANNREVFGLVFFLSRLHAGFAADAPELSDPNLLRTVTTIATALLLVSTSAAAMMLARAEKKWRDGRDRRVALLIFQSVLGFLAVSFAVDVSLAHLVFDVTVSLYAVVLLAGNQALEPRWSVMWVLAGVSFGLGLLLAGGLLPLSVVFRIIPLGWLDGLAGNAPDKMLPLEKYVWYQIPLAGIYLTALALWLALVAGRGTAPNVPREIAPVVGSH